MFRPENNGYRKRIFIMETLQLEKIVFRRGVNESFNRKRILVAIYVASSWRERIMYF